MSNLRARLFGAAGAALLLAAGAPARADSTIMLADGRVLRGAVLRPGSAPGTVLIRERGGAEAALPMSDLLVVDFERIGGSPALPAVRLANGDQVDGAVSFLPPAARAPGVPGTGPLVKVSAGWGAVTVPLEWCAAIRLSPKAPLPPPVEEDTLFLATDRVQGRIQSVAGGRITILIGGKPVSLPLNERVHALALARRTPAAGQASPQAGKGLRIVVDLGGGERLSGEWTGLSGDLLTIAPDWGGTVEVPVASISRIEVKNGKLVYLSDMKPAEVREVPFLDTLHPYRADEAVSGRPLRLGGRTYRRGLGTHSRSELTYALDGAFDTFAATIGVDDAVAGEGSVVFRVFGDEKLLFESPVLRGGEPPRELKLDVRRVVLLRLEVDYADDGDMADHADWADARLLKR